MGGRGGGGRCCHTRNRSDDNNGGSSGRRGGVYAFSLLYPSAFSIDVFGIIQDNDGNDFIIVQDKGKPNMSDKNRNMANAKKSQTRSCNWYSRHRHWSQIWSRKWSQGGRTRSIMCITLALNMCSYTCYVNLHSGGG